MPKIGFKQSLEHKRKHLNKIRGERNGRWKGGIKSFNPIEYYRNYKREASRVRRHRMRGMGTFSIGEWENLKIQYGFTCPSCGESEPEIKLTVDHIIPVSKGGSNNIENIQPLCMPCNRRKYVEIVKF